MNQALVQDVVSEVMRRLSQPHEPAPKPAQIATPTGSFGIFTKVNDAVAAANAAQEKLSSLTLDQRSQIVDLIKSMASDNAEPWGKMELAETGIGRLDHKIEKLQIIKQVPGVEFLKTRAYSGSDGVTLEEFAPFGVIGIVTPVTHSVPTLTSNAISMISAGNAIVANAHPAGANCAAHAARAYNQAIAQKFGIDSLITMVMPPTLETAQEIFTHKKIDLIVVTGGPAVARAAQAARRRAIVAGPGNPPVVVDETASIKSAAAAIVRGAAYDNNLLCIGEKEVFCVQEVFDKLMTSLADSGAHILSASQVAALTKVVFGTDDFAKKPPHLDKQFVGKDAAVLAQAIGLRVPAGTQLLVGRTDADHPFVQEEQMMPFLPVVPVKNVAQAIDLAVQAEHGYGHTAIIHSQNLSNITAFARRAAVSLFVVNGPSMASLGLGGEGYLSYSIATPTGEGVTNPLTFTRFRRVTVCGSLRTI